MWKVHQLQHKVCAGTCWIAASVPVGVIRVIIVTQNSSLEKNLTSTEAAGHTDVLFCPPLKLLLITRPIFPTFPPPFSPPCMWCSVFSDPQLPYLDQVKLNYWGMFPCSMADPVGLSMGALPLHWQPGDFHFKGGGAPSRQLSHIIPTVFAVFVSTVQPWAKATGLMMCACEAHLRSSPAWALLRHSASVTAGHPAQLRVLWMHSSP